MDETYLMVAYIAVGGIVGAAVASAKGASMRAGFCWGFVLGPIGWIVAGLVLQPALPRTICRFCRQPADAKAVRCPHCHEDLSGGRGPLLPDQVDKVMLAEKMARARALARKAQAEAPGESRLDAS